MANEPFNNVDKAMYPEMPGELPGPQDQDLDISMEEGPMDEGNDNFLIEDDEDGGVAIT